MKQVLVLHGPNLNLLGVREPEIYGTLTLDEINRQLVTMAEKLDVQLKCYQSNHEGELIDKLHEAASWAFGVVFNPAGYTHASVALRDAIAAIQIPVIEVHLSNISGRESFRQTSLTAAVCTGVVAGFGWRSYLYALQALVDITTTG